MLLFDAVRIRDYLAQNWERARSVRPEAPTTHLLNVAADDIGQIEEETVALDKVQYVADVLHAVSPLEQGHDEVIGVLYRGCSWMAAGRKNANGSRVWEECASE